MKENEVEKCSCNIGFEKGAIKKSCEFENFSIFGNLMKNNTIVIRYKGSLIKKVGENNKIILYYVFNNDWTNKKEIILAPCDHDKACYCATLDLERNMCITFGFCNTVGEYDKDLANSYSLKIMSNTLDDIMKRYGVDDNTDLPITQDEAKNIHKVSSIFAKLKYMFCKFFAKV